jgi:hypothetical protein
MPWILINHNWRNGVIITLQETISKTCWYNIFEQYHYTMTYFEILNNLFIFPTIIMTSKCYNLLFTFCESSTTYNWFVLVLSFNCYHYYCNGECSPSLMWLVTKFWYNINMIKSGLDINFKCWYDEHKSRRQMCITKNIFPCSKTFVDFIQIPKFSIRM